MVDIVIVYFVLVMHLLSEIVAWLSVDVVYVEGRT